MNRIVLMYHDVYEHSVSESGFTGGSNDGYSISKRVFETHVKAVSDYLSQKNIKKEFVCWTFDDGGVSFAMIIAPILEKYGFKGCFYIATKYINTPGFVNSIQIKSLQKSGHLVGAHSHTHPARMQDLPDDTIKKEWSQSIEILSQIIGTTVQSVTIPGGNYSKKMGKILCSLGVTEIYTTFPTDSIKKIDGCKIMGRYTVKAGISAEDVVSIISSPMKRFKMKVIKGILQIFKNLLGRNYDVIKEFILTRGK